MMKGITNAELRQKLDQIESEINELKKMKHSSYNVSFLAVSILCAIFSTMTYLFSLHPILLFFMMASITSTVFFLGRYFIEDK